MDCYNNYIDYRNGPSPYMHPYHHTSLHPAALRYAPSHQHHHFSRNAYGNSYPNYYDTSYRYYHQYSSNAYNHPAIPPPTPPPSHYQNYASLREGFSGSSNSNNNNSNNISGNILDSDHYPNSGYYGQSSPFTSTTATTPGINPYENYRQSNYHHPMAYHRSSNSYYSDTFYDTYEAHHHPPNLLSSSTTATNPSTPSGTPKSAYTDEYPSSPAMIRSESRCEKDVESAKSETSCKNEAPGTPGENMATTTTPTPIDISQSNMPPSSPMTPNSTEMSNSTSESFCNTKGNRSVRRSNQRERTLMTRKITQIQCDPYEFTEDHNNSTSPHTESRVPNNECSSQAWMHQGVQNTHKWMRGHHNKKGLPMSDLELLQSSFEYGFYNNNYHHPNNNEAYRMSRKVNEKHFISDGPNDIVPVKRTKRRRRENNTSEMFNNRKVEEKIERKPPEPPLTPLPGFQEAFGSTEIGRFSDAFFNVLNSSPYYEPNNESDIDTLSPQPWEAGDSLEGPHFNLQVGASFTPVYDNYSADGSPLDNYFSELSCNEF